MKPDSNREQVKQLIAGADEEALIGLLAIGHVISGKEIDSIGKHSKAVLKRAVKRLRGAQARVPEYAGEFEEAIQYIRQKWLVQDRREAHR